jgi:ADP-ribose pyrophosphatase YjhB (NUDIX family)
MTAGSLEHFRHFRTCPRCGATADEPNRVVPFRCAQCGFVLFFNAAAAVAAFVTRADGHVLFIRRARDPGRGKLGLPGGFVDFGETAEEATRRETREEVGLELGPLRYLASFPNVYSYAGVIYHTLDVFFVAVADAGQVPRALDAVESVCWLDPMTVDLGEIAFPSMQSAVEALRRTIGYDAS